MRKSGKIFLHPSVINTEELISSGCHVDIIRLVLRPFLVHKSVNGIVSGGTPDEAVHDLEEGLAQIGRTFFVAGMLLRMRFPESSFPGSTPAKAVSSILRRRDSTVADAVFNIATACRISSFVQSSFGNTAIMSVESR